MTEDFINKITLEYLLNKEYNLSVNAPKAININKNDKRFYRKRVYNLTKDLLVGEPPDSLSGDVKYSFENYVKSCIQYFKTIDKSDIIQEDYKDIPDDMPTTAVLNESTLEKANETMMRSVKVTGNSLDGFITRKASGKKLMILPKQREINLKDPILKNKGIKKKNLTNKYDEKKNQTENETTKKENEITQKTP